MNVSVVIPLYNKARHIRRAVDSVLSQTHQDFELVVIDDGSTDGSGDVVREITDPRIRLVVQKNGGECAARNRGIQEAHYELIAFLDADDEWLSCFLATVLGLLARHPEAGMYATAYSFCRGDANWRPVFVDCALTPEGGLLEDYFRSGLGPPPVTSSSVMIPKRILQAVGGFPAGVKQGGDLHTWARVALRYRVAWSPVVGAVYHLSADNRVCDLDMPLPDAAPASAIDEFLQSGGKPISPPGMVEEYMAYWRLALGLRCYLQDRRAWALKLLQKTRGTILFRRKRRLLFCLIWVPSCLARIMLRVKALVRALFGTTPNTISNSGSSTRVGTPIIVTKE